MKKLIFATALLALAGAASAQTNVHIDVGQPGFYGSIDIGDGYRPRVYQERPIVVERTVRYVDEPVYLRVPPGHRKNWRKHCYRYNACGRQVYFVRDDWYQDVYAPRYREVHNIPVRRPYVVQRPATRVVERYVEVDRGGRRDYDRHEDRGHDRHEGHGEGHGNGHGGGHGNGHGRGHGKD
jgi:hypothetical protein